MVVTFLIKTITQENLKIKLLILSGASDCIRQRV